MFLNAVSIKVNVDVAMEPPTPHPHPPQRKKKHCLCQDIATACSFPKFHKVINKWMNRI